MSQIETGEYSLRTTPTVLADGLGLEEQPLPKSTEMDSGIRPDFLVPPLHKKEFGG